MHPDWLGSPQHFVAGLLLSGAVTWLGRSHVEPTWLLCVFVVAVTGAAELLVELLEYPVLYADHFHRSAYYDTLADMADTMVGGFIGTALGLIAARQSRHGRLSL